MNNLGANYNFVILGSDWDLYLYSYSELYKYDNIKYISSAKESLGFLYPLYKLHCSSSINNRIKLPLKQFWNRLLFRDDFYAKRPICFVCFGYWAKLMLEHDLADYLRKRYSNSRIIWFAQDLMDNQRELYTSRKIDINAARSKFDIIISFDQNDCKKYNFEYHPLVFSKFEYDLVSMPYYDVYFLGKDKNRLELIIQTYDILEKKGLKLKFYIVDCKDDQKIERKGIEYISGMSYLDNLQHVLHSKCVLEIMQEGGHGFTQRCAEILGFNKKLLTNNPEIMTAPFYNQAYISYFENPAEIDIDFISKIQANELVDYNYTEKLSPVNLIQFIEEKLS